MKAAIVPYQKPSNEPALQYSTGSPERTEIEHALTSLSAMQVERASVINGKLIESGNLKVMNPPHNIHHTLGQYHLANNNQIDSAIESALKAKTDWMQLSFSQRAAVFLKAADLLSGPYRAKINAATMLGQSKNVIQAEIDSACELADFLRFNVYFANQIMQMQPDSAPGLKNYMYWRPLEGFIFALTPFNFTAIAGNLPTAPAILGNTVVWKPSKTQVYSAAVFMDILQEAGLPDGVINMVLSNGRDIAETVMQNPNLAGFHFTGSTRVFQGIWNFIGNNISNYKTYPRIVGETGGKDFVFVHASADTDVAVTALIRGAFGYQGQKCSAASRAYIPQSLWPTLKERLIADAQTIKTGDVMDFGNFMNAVIDEVSFDKLAAAIEKIKADSEAEIITGGGYNKTDGYFIEPTIAVTTNPYYFSMQDELFGPVLTLYIYKDTDFESTLEICNNTSAYGLTGAIISTDRHAIYLAEEKLRFAAGNFYINDKPTGAVVNQQPFGGARGSGTNDKAGSILNLLRWVSPQTIKENFVPPKDYRYPFMHLTMGNEEFV